MSVKNPKTTREWLKWYFLLFGNKDEWEEPDYWEREYIQLWQFLIGLLFSPIFLVVSVFMLLFTLKIPFKK